MDDIYISKQQAAKAFQEYHDADVEVFGVEIPECFDAQLAIEIMNEVPAADVRPVVKAHWTDHRTNEHDGEWYCSACGKAITIYMGPDRDDRYSYCPNCGADMREAHDGI